MRGSPAYGNTVDTAVTVAIGGKLVQNRRLFAHRGHSARCAPPVEVITATASLPSRHLCKPTATKVGGKDQVQRRLLGSSGADAVRLGDSGRPSWVPPASKPVASTVSPCRTLQSCPSNGQPLPPPPPPTPPMTKR